MIGKVTALFKTERWFKRPRLDQISTSVDACAILGGAMVEKAERLRDNNAVKKLFDNVELDVK